MKKENCCKTPKVIGKISDHQWGVVFSRGGCECTQTSSQWKFPCVVVRRWKNERDKSCWGNREHGKTEQG